jgi:DNA mismatch endonuclease (patch repair protein)
VRLPAFSSCFGLVGWWVWFLGFLRCGLSVNAGTFRLSPVSLAVKLDQDRPVPMDNLSRQERSERMSRIKSADTGPEMSVRRLVHGMGFRYRLHASDLPGTPDMVFPRLGKVVFVHGCFWHQHPGCGRQPKSRLRFWKNKLFQNRERDLRNQRKLRSLGWRILIV